MLTREYPPHVYGGAGVHVEFLSRELARRLEVEVRCFGDQRSAGGNPRVIGYPAPQIPARSDREPYDTVLQAFARNLEMARDPIPGGVVHAHTWYAHLAGLAARSLWSVPLVISTHSLEPLRPWKAEQLGRGYHLTSWVEKTAIEQADAVIAVSAATREDILRLFAVSPDRLHVIPNGIDLERYRPTAETGVLRRYNVDPERPYVLFVGRVTRQKGIIHLVRAAPHIDPGVQVVLAAGEPDTPEIAREMTAAVNAAAGSRGDLVWIPEVLPRDEVIQLYSHAAVFCCPSVYEPFGIINLEAMACEAPVVATRVGGIPEIVAHGETGWLVDCELEAGGMEPADPDGLARDLAQAINRIALDEEQRTAMGRNGRLRAESRFSWSAVAEATRRLYATLSRGPSS
ncbi:MAG: glycogen synthase [Candidatus Eisenbacteria bacterium]|nr:glycogen synthase [Candidatus Eisenbacteria bacterium]